MALSQRQIKYIEKKRKHSSAEKIAKDLNISPDEVQKYFDSHPAPSSTKQIQKAPFYFYIILVAIPVLFFVLLEIGLRVFHYGTDLSMWTTITENKLMLNPDVARRYFSIVKNVPSSIEDIFDKEKQPNAFRVFVLGESSAAGYPFMPLGSFSRYIRRRLELTYPHNKIEVVNIGLTAVNSYTIRDFIPEVLNQKPDLILIYTGHNEYYGALGVGSMESLGNSRTFVNLVLYLNKFKTTQLVKDFIQWSAGLFSSSEATKSGTLMARMAREQYIPFDSKDYQTGLSQFEDNMRDVIEMIKKANVPVILGTLTSNLKDQKPFISIKNEKFPPADQVYKEALSAYNSGNYKSAEFFFRKAKDLDALRFRAPEAINKEIKDFGKEFNIPIANVDSLFNADSPNGIVGNNLMTDHLHPTLQGYQLMGRLFYDEMEKMNYIPKDSKPAVPINQQDSLTVTNFPYTKLDSIISAYRIKLLKNDWPYIDPKNKVTPSILLTPKTFTDSLAFNVVEDGLNWAEAHEKLVDRCLADKKIDECLSNVDVLLYQYPIIHEYYKYYDKFAMEFLDAKDYDNAYKILLHHYQLQPNDFCTKWLGTIELNQSHIPSAIKYLEESVQYNSNDLQTLYNLAGAYALNKEYQKSYDTISKVLARDPSYPGAGNLMMQLQGTLSK